MNKKTLFILINSMESGGAERMISYISLHFSKKYNVKLILLKNALFYDISKNVSVIPLSNIKYNLLLFLLIPIYIFKLRALIKKYKPYKIISFLEIANFVNILSNKNAIICFCISLPFFTGTFVKKIYRFLIILLYPHAKKIVVNSIENAIDVTRILNIPTKKVHTIYNPIDTQKVRLDATRKINTQNIPSNKTTFITIGRLDDQKRTLILVELFAKSPPTNSILLIIGDGVNRMKLANMIKQNNLEDTVFLLGTKKNVFPYLKYADFFIFSSIAEGFPNVLMEAMSCNLPIITSDFKTGAREIIDTQLKYNTTINYPYYGPNGVLLSVDNFVNDFKKVNLKEITQHQKGIEKFDIKNTLRQWENIISK